MTHRQRAAHLRDNDVAQVEPVGLERLGAAQGLEDPPAFGEGLLHPAASLLELGPGRLALLGCQGAERLLQAGQDRALARDEGLVGEQGVQCGSGVHAFVQLGDLRRELGEG